MKAKRRYIILSAALILLVWELISMVTGPEHPLPGPWTILLATLGVLGNLSFLKTVGITLLRSLGGFAAAIIAGAALGIAAGLNDAVRSFLKPVVVLVRTTPVVVFVLLAIVWFTSGIVPVLIGVIMMFPIVYLNVSEGIRAVDANIVRMARFYGVRGWRLVKEVYLPAIRPAAKSAVSNAVGLGWRAIVAAEVLSQPEWGIGASMHAAQIMQRVDVLMAWALVTVVFGAVFEKIVDYGYRA